MISAKEEKKVDLQHLLNKQPILLFDGECGFCNRTILFYLKRERKKTMHFASLESEEGKALRSYFEIDKKIDSIILIRNHDAFIKSCAALRLTGYMKGLWPLMLIFVIIPPFIRNRFYEFIAARRIKLFGRVGSCELLKAEDRSRFLSPH